MRYGNDKKFSLLGKSRLCCPVLVLALVILGFVGKGTAPLVGQIEVEMVGGFFLLFLLSLFLSAVHCKQEP
jgi:hypothetical protein